MCTACMSFQENRSERVTMLLNPFGRQQRILGWDLLIQQLNNDVVLSFCSKFIVLFLCTAYCSVLWIVNRMHSGSLIVNMSLLHCGPYIMWLLYWHGVWHIMFRQTIVSQQICRGDFMDVQLTFTFGPWMRRALFKLPQIFLVNCLFSRQVFLSLTPIF